MFRIVRIVNFTHQNVKGSSADGFWRQDDVSDGGIDDSR